jgi:transposase-like protein
MRKPRKNYSPSEKVAILRRHLIDRAPTCDLCDEYQLSPNLFYVWHIGQSKFHDWHRRYGLANEHNAWVPRDWWPEE